MQPFRFLFPFNSLKTDLDGVTNQSKALTDTTLWGVNE